MERGIDRALRPLRNRVSDSKWLRALQQRIAATGALCVFAEPPFEPRLMATVLEATDARAAVLDPLGAELPAGPDQYFALLGGMAKSLIECLEERAGG